MVKNKSTAKSNDIMDLISTKQMTVNMLDPNEIIKDTKYETSAYIYQALRGNKLCSYRDQMNSESFSWCLIQHMTLI